jgi:peptide deformylase
MGRGLAAPQIGAPMRMIYIEIDRPWFIINPTVTDIGEEDFWVWDDCFSLPNLMVRVQRAYQIEVVYQDLSGQRHGVKALGALAELLQHEIDHLDGVLSVDRPTGRDAFSLTEEWTRHHAAAGRYGEPEPRVPERDYFVGIPTLHA